MGKLKNIITGLFEESNSAFNKIDKAYRWFTIFCWCVIGLVITGIAVAAIVKIF